MSGAHKLKINDFLYGFILSGLTFLPPETTKVIRKIHGSVRCIASFGPAKNTLVDTRLKCQPCGLKLMQCCQLSWIIWARPDFGPYLPVSRLEFEISWIIFKVCHFFISVDNFLTVFKISTILRCLSYFNVNIKHFLVNFRAAILT